jgi:hypothetical protein
MHLHLGEFDGNCIQTITNIYALYHIIMMWEIHFVVFYCSHVNDFLADSSLYIMYGHALSGVTFVSDDEASIWRFPKMWVITLNHPKLDPFRLVV